MVWEWRCGGVIASNSPHVTRTHHSTTLTQEPAPRYRNSPGNDPQIRNIFYHNLYHQGRECQWARYEPNRKVPRQIWFTLDWIVWLGAQGEFIRSMIRRQFMAIVLLPTADSRHNPNPGQYTPTRPYLAMNATLGTSPFGNMLGKQWILSSIYLF